MHSCTHTILGSEPYPNLHTYRYSTHLLDQHASGGDSLPVLCVVSVVCSITKQGHCGQGHSDERERDENARKHAHKQRPWHIDLVAWFQSQHVYEYMRITIIRSPPIADDGVKKRM